VFDKRGYARRSLKLGDQRSKLFRWRTLEKRIGNELEMGETETIELVRKKCL
jgi:hypothetical protein